MSYLPPTRELRERLDTAQTLTRLFYRERAVVLACGGWIPHATGWRRRRSWAAPPGRARSPPTRSASASSSSAIRRGSSRSRQRRSRVGDARRPPCARRSPRGRLPRVRRSGRRARRRPVAAHRRGRAAGQGAAGRRARGRRAALPRRRRPATAGTSSRASTGPTCSTRRTPTATGVALQIRSAVSHLNEVWAVETAG